MLPSWRALRSSDFVGKVTETYATRIFLMGVALITTVVVARLLGPEGRGYYAVAVAIGALGAQFGSLGLHASNTYFVAKEPDSLPFLAGNSLAVSFVIGGLIAAAIAAILLIWPQWLGVRGATLGLALVWIPFGIAYLLLQNLMVGIHDVRGYNLVEIVARCASLLLVGALVVLGHVSVAALFSTTLIAVVLSCLWTARRLQTHFSRPPAVSATVFRSSIRYATKSYLTLAFCFLVLRADLFMVQHMLGPEQAGYYSIASTMADYASALAAVIGTILFPKLSALTDLREKLTLTRKAAVGTALILVPFLAAASWLARPAVRLLFGQAFLPASLAFVLLMPGMLFLGINAVAVQFLNSIGYPKIVVVIWGLCCLGNIGANIMVIPRYGISGASVVSSVSYFLACFSILCVIIRTGRNIPVTSGQSVPAL